MSIRLRRKAIEMYDSDMGTKSRMIFKRRIESGSGTSKRERYCFLGILFADWVVEDDVAPVILLLKATAACYTVAQLMTRDRGGSVFGDVPMISV